MDDYFPWPIGLTGNLDIYRPGHVTAEPQIVPAVISLLQRTARAMPLTPSRSALSRSARDADRLGRWDRSCAVWLVLALLSSLLVVATPQEASASTSWSPSSPNTTPSGVTADQLDDTVYSAVDCDVEDFVDEQVGGLDIYTYASFDLGPGMQVMANVANLNARFRQEMVRLPGVAGLDLEIDLVFETTYDDSTDLYYPYTYASGLDYCMFRDSAGDWILSADAIVEFEAQSGGGFATPAGYPATLTQPTASTLELEFDQTGEIWHFDIIDDASSQPGDLALHGSTEDRNGNTIEYRYDSFGYAQSVVDTRGQVTTISYNASDEAVITDPFGRTHTIGFDSQFLDPEDYTDPSGAVTTFTHASGYSTITDARDNQTTISYVGEQRLRIARDVGTGGPLDGDRTDFNLTSATQSTVRDPRGDTTTYTFGADKQVTAATDQLGITRSSSYGPFGNVTSYTDGLTSQSTLGYDPTGRKLTSATAPTGASTSVAYADTNHPYLPTTLSDAQGNDTDMTYDTAGNIDTVTDANNDAYDVDFNTDGTISQTTDPRGNRTQFTYDTDARLTGIAKPDGPLEDVTYGYDAASRVTSITDGRDITTTITYDILDRPLTVSYPGGATFTYTYDDVGNLTARTSAAGTTSYTFDGYNRLATEKLPARSTTTYGWDANSNLTSITDTTGTTVYRYDDVNRVDRVTEPDGSFIYFTYDNDGNRDTITYPNGVTIDADVDASGRTTSLTATGPGSTVIQDLTYTYTNGANDTSLLQTVTDQLTSETITYTYDPANRVTAATADGTTDDYTFGYDAAGNRTSRTAGTTSQTATYNGADQLTQLVDGSSTTTYTYDDAGNLNASTDGFAATYDQPGRTTSITNNGTTQSYTYAGRDQTERLQAGTLEFTDTLLGVSSTHDGTNTTGWTRTPNGELLAAQTPSGGDEYFITDIRGSVTAVTNSSGATVATYQYSPYGHTTATTGTGAANRPWQYIGAFGYHTDTTDLTKVGHRYLNPLQGRWTQPDPSNQEPNTYLYAGANPCNTVDPTGLLSAQDQTVIGCIIAYSAVIFDEFALLTALLNGSGVGLALAALGVSVVALLVCDP